MHVGFMNPLLWLCHQEKVVPCPTRLWDTSISENQKNVFSHSGMTTSKNIKGAVSWQSSSICLILPITHPQSLWNLKQAKKLQVNDKIRDPRQTNGLLSIIFEVASSRDQLSKALMSIRFNLLQFCPSVHLLFLLCYFNLPLKF